MNKLKLRLDDLRVDTFETNAARKEKGTVFGEQCTCYTQCDTCYQSCEETCGYNCVSLHTCDYQTCPGFATVREGERYCIYC
jgi:hypothetical protein